MGELIPFKYENNEIRIIQDETGTPWWVAKDVCSLLGYKNHSDAASNHLDEDEKGVVSADTLGGKQDLLVVNESGLYTLILKSRKPEARPFRKWVTSEVLPAIRNAGTYSMKRSPVEQDSIVAASNEFEAALKITKLLGLEGNQAAIPANEAVKKLTGVDCLELLGMKQLVCEKQEIHLTATELGKDLGMSAQKTNKLIESFGLIESYRDQKDKLKWKPTEKGKPHTVLKDTAKKYKDGTPIQQMYYLESIKEAISN